MDSRPPLKTVPMAGTMTRADECENWGGLNGNATLPGRYLGRGAFADQRTCHRSGYGIREVLAIVWPRLANVRRYTGGDSTWLRRVCRTCCSPTVTSVPRHTHPRGSSIRTFQRRRQPAGTGAFRAARLRRGHEAAVLVFGVWCHHVPGGDLLLPRVAGRRHGHLSGRPPGNGEPL